MYRSFNGDQKSSPRPFWGSEWNRIADGIFGTAFGTIQVMSEQLPQPPATAAAELAQQGRPSDEVVPWP